ncbi:MAG: hypothetical protein F9K41_00095 [Sphingopyxis terrae]|nr:MAG: hypothetical protein F9K41_00095 [Sphingopyxis terrae]
MAAHKRIWAWPAFGPESVTGSWSANTYHDERTVAYILAAEHDRIVAEKDAEIAAARDKALDDAARMVDCACECRDAVLAAKTKVDRWNACGRDPCGALDAADIRAMKGSGTDR